MADYDFEHTRFRTSRLKKGLDAFGNMFALNIAFVLTSLPIFTIGASLSALYAMCIRLQENEEETVWAGYFHEFKRSFKQATIAWLIILACLFVFWGEYTMINTVGGGLGQFYTIVLIIELALFAMFVPFLFPLIARYNNSLKMMFANAFMLSVRNLWSWAKVVLAWFVPIYICVRYPFIFISIWYLWLLIIFGAIAWGTSHTIRAVFKKTEEAAEKPPKKTDE